MSAVAQNQTRRNWVLGTALAATLGLVVWMESQGESTDDIVELARPSVVVSAEKPAVKNENAPDNITKLDWKALQGREVLADAKSATDLFKPQSWYVPPPPKAAELPLPPPKPVAPAAPFTYIGKMEDTPQGNLLMLSANNKLYTVAVGDVLDKTWRLDSEDANTMLFTYLPLGLPQTLSKAAAAKTPATNSKQTKQIENQGNNQ